MALRFCLIRKRVNVWLSVAATASVVAFWGGISLSADKEIEAAIRDVLKDSKKATTDTDLKILTNRLLKIIDQAVNEDDYSNATRACTTALDLAKKSENMQTVYRVQQKQEDVKAISKEYKSITAAVRKLASNPEDPGANRTVGLFRSAVQGQWALGAKLLERCGDAGLIAIAKGEAADPSSVEDQAKLGENWKTASRTESNWLQKCMQKRASWWLARAFRSSTETKVREKLFTELADMPLMYLTDMQEEVILAGPWPYERYGKNGTGRNITVDGIKYELGLGMHADSKVRFKLNGDYRTLSTGCALCDSEVGFTGKIGFEVWGDGKQLWRSSPISQRNDAEYATINVKGIQTLEIRTTGAQGGGHSVWLDPCLSK